MTAELSAAPLPSAERARVVLAATFTVDPLTEPLSFLLGETGLELDVEVAPYSQIFQELLDPSRMFGRNRRGINALFVRFEDWWRDKTGPTAAASDPVAARKNCDDLIGALRGFSESTSSAIFLAICPPSPAALAHPETAALLHALRDQLIAGVAGLANLTILQDQSLGEANADVAYDAAGDRLGHVPYTPLFYAGLARAIARAAHVLKSPPHKVLVLDCDNTLWKGVVGEDGVDGIGLPEPYLALQRFVVEKKNAGMLICLASKNTEADVIEVFRRRSEMILKLDDIVSMRVNWLPKSENLWSLAKELNLGIDSFVLVDDSPLECGEVESNCPGALVLRLPIEGDFPRFLSHVWPLDDRATTEADRRRTEMYRENRERDRHRQSASNLAEFMAGLDLRIEIAEPTADERPRVAQLTQRTNQFNFTTRRRTEGEILNLAAEGRRCLAVQVKDRFGDYGLVGEVIFSAQDGDLVIDTFLLSCRVLGRGVEHTTLRHLGGVGAGLGLNRVVAPFIPTAKNVPAKQFLESLGAQRETADGVERFILTVERASAIFPVVEAPFGEPDGEEKAPAPRATGDSRKSARWNRLARELAEPEQILSATARGRLRERLTGGELVPPRTATERRLVAIWQEALNVRQVGIRDDYFEIGGTSLATVMICAAIEKEFDKNLPLTVFLEFPTIEALAARIERVEEIHSLVPLQQGGAGVPLFLVHDADGETLLYRNLALRFAGRRPVYAIQPEGREDAPIVHTRIEEMAAHYVREIRKVRPRGPYLLGGLCAAGVLSFEMALQLEQAGEEARLVAVFDAADVEARPRARLENQRRVGRLREAMQTSSLAQLPLVAARKAKNYLAHVIGRRVRGVSDRVSVETLRLCLDRGLPLPPWARRVPVRTVYLNAESKYRPRATTRNEIVLFRATSGQDADEPYVQLFEDPDLGWKKRSAGGVLAIDVPGGHSSMLQEPNVSAVAKALDQYLATTP